MRTTRQIYFAKIAFYLTVLSLLSAYSCIPTINTNNKMKVEVEHLEEAIKTLNTGINTLRTESGSWQETLKDVQKKIADDVQSTIETEITQLIDHGVSVIGQESRCNVDFVAKRSRIELIRIKNELITKRNGLAQKIGIPPIPLDTVPPVKPAICIVSPSSLDLTLPPDRRKTIDISGYDFDSAPIVVLLKNGDQEIDVTHPYLGQTSPFLISLNVGANGVRLSSNSQQFIVRADGKQISSINIISPSAQQDQLTNPVRADQEVGNGGWNGSIAATDGYVYLATPDGKLRRGKISSSVGTEVIGDAGWNGSIAAADGYVYLATPDGKLRRGKISSSVGTEVIGDAGWNGSIAVADGYVYVATPDGKLRRGKISSSVGTEVIGDAGWNGSIAATDGFIFLATPDGRLLRGRL
ncbi:PQQ-binding-like beta-propeller repeat protein [Coleofasciculus sp. FACHB-712]|uniref:PQQ-binding-like beta-propeller repeat protein n=1 Tax=Coleofasciculus sp. FACHB-712 TaxID=2692789 RepID=UPI001686B632|nr:PQQ-binding-like beta-propeller repeat protein [Coleofasciculus sp. FACHB-712]MBD1942296.1 PQQ-binding-like beta-propeller repeat protein [Coleofasciculus sp. FACHB-712]